MKVRVNVKPRSKEEKIEKISEKEYKIWVKERAEKGEANKRVVNLLAKEFDVSASRVKIKNLKSRKKIIEIIYDKK